MHVPIEFLRGVLAFLGGGCAYMTGRSAAAVRKGWQKPSRLYGWIVRTVVCAAAVAFRHSLDAVDIVVWFLMAMAFLSAFLSTSREKHEEDLTRAIFPGEPEGPKPEGPKSESPKPEGPKPDAPVPEAPKPEGPDQP